MLKIICATTCSNNHKHPQIHSQDSLHFIITLAVLRGASSDSPDPLGASSDSPDLLGASSDSPDTLGASSGSSNPLVAGSVSPDPKVMGSGSPDPLVVASSRPTSWMQCLLRAGGIYTFPFPSQQLSTI